MTRSLRPGARRTLAVVAAAAPLALLVAGCTENVDPDDAAEGTRALSVTASDDGCEVSATDAPAGTLTFDVTNSGDEVTEFYLLDGDGLRIVGEVENIAPNTSAKLTVNAVEGDYQTACKPGMVGDGIRADFAVTTSDEEVEVSEDDQAVVDDALANYAAYVEDQAGQLLVKTEEFAALVQARDDDAARALYPEARVHWERIETVAESFGTLDPDMDLREADLEPDQEWTGWHRLEKELWPEDAVGYTPMTDAERTEYTEHLVGKTEELVALVAETEYTIDDLSNGSRGLLEEVATGKITGEEEAWSHTDLWDFQANVDGARVAYEGVRPLVESSDPDLATTLDDEFASLQALLDALREGDGFVSYDTVGDEQRGELSDAVNALSEPLSLLTAAVVS
ncbi:iron uptake system protein EfeO [Nocardioides alkalitolerans]|uniref:iron uptake system protein EfeO n=1 Tax=Nocardioides alkalitolerans TaxID=281714 RepID=UPI000421B408|nr:iron uptake system protein EfeO [Nocardioides alkalitolerans]